MTVHQGYEGLKFNNPVVTLGTFDGVHRGHRELLQALVSAANRSGGESVVVTFSPHPRLVLSENPEELSFLTTIEERERLLKETGIGHLIIVKFNEHLVNMGACEFIKKVLVDKIAIKHLIVGYDHHFGRGRAGDFNTISRCAMKYGFTVEQVKEVSANQGTISSTSIRVALLNGRLDEANRYLGYSYSLTGTVIQGRRIGRIIGFPTANIMPSDRYKLLPGNGVYAVEVDLDGNMLKGMLSIGSNPTINPDPRLRSVEVNIFGFDGDLYGRVITVVFRFRLRDEIRFKTLSRLSRQMELDREQALKLLTE
ncbi:MAG: bifunctional riboflavin kinase/FAD synthetase [Bacteroidales bacterium]